MREIMGHFGDDYPQCNVRVSSAGQQQIDIMVAGMDENKIEIVLNNGILTLNYDHEGDEVLVSGWQTVHKGINLESWEMTIALRDDMEIVDAVTKNGILTIRFVDTVLVEPKPTKIKIQKHGEKQFLSE